MKGRLQLFVCTLIVGVCIIPALLQAASSKKDRGIFRKIAELRVEKLSDLSRDISLMRVSLPYESLKSSMYKYDAENLNFLSNLDKFGEAKLETRQSKEQLMYAASASVLPTEDMVRELPLLDDFDCPNFSEINFLSCFNTDYLYSYAGHNGNHMDKGYLTITDNANGKNYNVAGIGRARIGASGPNFLAINSAVYSSAQVPVKKPWKAYVSVSAGKVYRLNAWTRTVSPGSVVGPIHFFVNNEKVSSVGYTPPLNPVSDQEWVYISYDWTATITGTVEIALAMYPAVDQGHNFALDDIAFSEIISVTASPAVVCSGGSSMLKASGSPSGLYRWYNANGIVIANENGSTLALENITSDRQYVVEDATPGGTNNRASITITVLPQPVVTFESSHTIIKTGKNVTLYINGANSNNYTVTWGDGNTEVLGSQLQATHAYSTKGEYQVTIKATNETICSATSQKTITVYSELWTGTFPPIAKADINSRTGSYILLDECANEYFLEPFSYAGIEEGNIVSTSYMAYDYGPLSNKSSSNNPYLDGQRNIRPITTFQYNTHTATSHGENSEAGTFKASPFNWQSDVNHHISNWLPGNKVTAYSPNGDVLEEVNALGIKSSAKFGYGSALPYLLAQNAAHSEVLFESFEVNYTPGGMDGSGNYISTFEDGFTISDNEGGGQSQGGHSGNYSLHIPTNEEGKGFLNLPSVSLSPAGILVRVWVYANDEILPDDFIKLTLVNNFSKNMNQVARVGEWALYEISFTDQELPDIEVVKPSFSFSRNPYGRWSLLIDDLLIQPLNAQLACYVYDERSLKLLTSFDAQHFGLYYQYNEEGQLVRKRIETERGIKTIQETQYNLPKVEKILE